MGELGAVVNTSWSSDFLFAGPEKLVAAVLDSDGRDLELSSDGMVERWLEVRFGSLLRGNRFARG